MTTPFLDHLALQTEQLHAEGLYKAERVIASPQDAVITLEDGAEVINFCANNYLGLADDAHLIATAKHALDSYGYGMASVRFICGTQTIHPALEAEISSFLGTESTILYSSCWDANGGLFETVLGPDDAIISDALNHASSTEYAFARPSGSGMPTTTWTTYVSNLRQPGALATS